MSHSQTDRQTDRQDTTGQTGQTDNGLIAQGEPFYKRSPKNAVKSYVQFTPLTRQGVTSRRRSELDISV